MGTALMGSIPGRHFFRNLIERRALLYQLVRRDFERRFVGSVGGWLWGVIHPLVLLASWTFVFHVCLKMGVPRGSHTDNYTLSLFCGYLPWMLFQETVQRATTSILDQANLVTKTVFPSEMIPLSIFCSTLVSHLLTLAVALGALVLWGEGLTTGLLVLPVYVFLLALLSVGVAWVVAAFQVYLRDTAQGVAVLLTLWFWATPIFISVGDVPENLQPVLRLNPLTGFVSAYRDLLLSYEMPGWRELAYLAALSLGVFLAGGAVFRQLKRGFADVL